MPPSHEHDEQIAAKAPRSSYRLRHALFTRAWLQDAGWHEAWYVLSYPVKTWRCRLFDHKWGPEDADYDPNVGVRLQASRECQRKGCEGYWETFHYMGGERVWG